MTQSPSTPGGYEQYRAFLDERSPALRQAIVDEICARNPFYAALPPEQVHESVARTFGLIRDLLAHEDPRIFQQEATARIARRLREGLSIDDALSLPYIYHRQIQRLSMQAASEQIPRASEGLELVSTMLERVELEMLSAYRDRINQLEALVGNALDGVLIYGFDARVTYANRAISQMFRAEAPAGLVGRLISDMIAPEDRQRIDSEINEGLRSSGGWEGQIWALRSDDERWLAQISVFTLRSVSGKAIGFGAITRDVTEISRSAQERLRLLLDLEQQTTALQRYQALVENAADGVMIVDLDGAVAYANPAWRRMIGFGDDIIGARNTSFVASSTHEELAELVRETMERGTSQARLIYRRPDGSQFPALVTNFLIRDGTGAPQARGVLVRDITDLERSQVEREQLQQQVIDAQEAAIRELSTPLIPLADGVVAMPLVGTISPARAQQIMEVLLEGIGRHSAEVAVLDITGVRLIDTQVADALLRAARAARLLGAQVVLTGIGAEIAQTLVGLGADLSGITTLATLREGISMALR